MSKSKAPQQARKETEASKFLDKSSDEGQASPNVSEGESKAGQASEAASEPSGQAKPEASKGKPAVKAEESKASEVPGKYRKFQ